MATSSSGWAMAGLSAHPFSRGKRGEAEAPCCQALLASMPSMEALPRTMSRLKGGIRFKFGLCLLQGSLHF